MRKAWIALMAVAWGCAGCGRSVPVVTPFAETSASLSDFSGRLLLDDQSSLKVSNGRVLGDWVCGRTGPAVQNASDVCVPTARVAAVEQSKWRAGPADTIAKAVTVVIMAPVIAIWGYSELEDDREARAATVEDAERRRKAAERGEPLPPPPTAESYRRESAFYSLANCSGVRSDERDHTDGEILSDQVWKTRQACLTEASQWFLANGQIDQARHLMLIDQARGRYEKLICGSGEPGLFAPSQDLIGAAGGRWMDEYRAVVADNRTYDYEPAVACDGRQAPFNALVGSTDALGEARQRAVSRFPLTDPEMIAAAISARSSNPEG